MGQSRDYSRGRIDQGKISVFDAHEFAAAWQRAWNVHDLDAALSHFSDDVVFTSPVAAQLLPETHGTVRGIDALREYWTAGLTRIPDLRFEVVNVYVGVSTIVINYRNHVGGLVNEVLTVTADGVLAAGAGTYLAADAADSSGVTERDER